MHAVHDTLAVQEAINDTLSVLKDAETGQRGFVLTGSEEFLVPHAAAQRSLPEKLKRLQRLVGGDAAQKRSAQKLAELTRIKLGELAETIALRRQGHGVEAVQVISEGRGRRLMQTIRAESDRMLARETARLAERERSAVIARQQLTVTLTSAWAFFVCLTAAGLWSARRGIREARQATDRLHQQTAWLESILSSMGDGVVVLDRDGRALIVNPAAKQQIGLNVGQRAADLTSAESLPAERASGRPGREDPLYRALRGERCDAVELSAVDAAGVQRIFSVTAYPILEDGAASGCVAVYHDVSEQRRAEMELESSEERLRVLSEASFEGVAITKSGTILDTNENFASWLGREPHELLGTEHLSHFAPEDRALAERESSQSNCHYEAHMLRRGGERFPVEVRDRNLTFRGQTVRITVVRDITERRRAETELKQQAELLRAMSLRDELTGLYNRRGFLEHARQALRTSTRTRRAACVFFADLNGMKKINDSLGHEMGDRAIVLMAQLLSGAFRASDIIGRLGGDEFAIFAPDCGAQDVQVLCRRLQQRLEDLNRTSGEPFQLSISVGFSEFKPGSPTDLNSLMEAADQAMYAEKRRRVSVESRAHDVPEEPRAEAAREHAKALAPG